MSADGFLAQAFVYLAAAVVAVPVAKRLGLGSVLGYLTAGAIIGPFGLGFAGAERQDVLHVAEFGVVMMLFIVGLELQPALLWRMRAPVLGLGSAQVGLTGAALGALALALGLPWQAALAVGLILAMSSTAIALQTLEEKGLLRTGAGQDSFAVLLFQDLSLVPILALLPVLATAPPRETEGHGAPSWIAGLPGWAQMLVVLAAVGAIVAAGRFLVRPLLRIVARTRLREAFTAASLVLVVGIALLMTRVGLSPALGTFLAGVVLATSEYRHELETDLEPFKGLLLGVFFISVGAAVDFRLVASRPALVAALVVSLVVVKLVAQLVLARLYGMSLDQGILFSSVLAQGGEFAFVLLAYAGGHGVLAPEVGALLVAVVALSMATTPLVLLAVERGVLPRVGIREQPGREADDVHGDNPVIVAGFGRFGHIVGRLLAANGIGATVLDVDSDQVDLLRRLGLKVFYGDASRVDLLRAAGALRAKVLVVAVDGPEKGLEIVRNARKHFPHLEIFARAYGRQHAYELLDAGVTRIYRETLDTSLRLGVDAMRCLGRPSYPAWRAARTFRAHDEDSVRELAAIRHDRSAYLSRARERIRDLERVLQSDREDAAELRDAAWDTESLRKDFGARPQQGARGEGSES